MNNNFNIKRINKVYTGMKERCNDPEHISYKNYGAKGVTVICGRREFVKWYLRNVTEEMIKPSVDRKDSDGHYELSNMRVIPLRENVLEMFERNPRWDVKCENMRKANENRSGAVTIDGIEYRSVREAARLTGIGRDMIIYSIKKHGKRDFISKRKTIYKLEVNNE